MAYAPRGAKGLSKQEAFDIFLRDYHHSQAIEENKQVLKQRYGQAKALGERLNTSKQRISDFSEEDLEEMEHGMREEMEREKIMYKETFVQLRTMKTEIEHLQHLLEKAKVKMMKDFEMCSAKPGVSGSGGGDIPLTGDPQADADIMAFIRARQNILQQVITEEENRKRSCTWYPKELSYQLEEFFRPEIYREVDISPPRGFLLHGPPGCGKTLLANCIAGHLSVPFLKVGSTELVSGVSGDSEQKIRDLFEQAVTVAPCVIFIDEIDCIAPKRENASKDMERRIVTQLMLCMDELNTKSESILVLGATNRPDAIDPALRVPGRFDIEISLGIPDQKAREAILCKLCQKMRLSSDFDFKTVARACPGYVGGDLVALKRQAGLLAVKRCSRLSKHHHSSSDTLQNSSVTSSGPWVAPMVPDKLSETEKKPLTEEEIEALTITPDDFMEALKKVQPSAKREGFATVPDVTWDDVGALGDVREVLNTAILGPVRYPEMCESFGLEGASGVLLVGPPGCGKTLVAKAVANESGINFISVKGPELMNMYVGESERAVRQMFQRARNSSPCVIFFDELDSLCPRRSDHENQSSARVVNQLLTEMDGLETRKQVYIMAATNRADIIDPAVLRPGRLDKIVHVGMPGAHDRYEILLTITKNGTKPCLDTDVDLKDIAESSQCNGFSGADLAALVREAATMAMKEMLKNPGQAASERRVVTRAHFDHALTVVRPSVSRLTQESYKRAADKAW
nr:hypothetical protein BaRGS_035165 [Batillaria attramentaria]